MIRVGKKAILGTRESVRYVYQEEFASPSPIKQRFELVWQKTHACTLDNNTMKSTLRLLGHRSLARSSARTAHTFARSALLLSLARSVALIRSLTRSFTRSQAPGIGNHVHEVNAWISMNLGKSAVD